RDPYADEEAPRCRAHPGATPGQSGAPPAAAADRACQQQCQALSYRQRPHSSVERRYSGCGDGDLLRPAQFPGPPESLATYDLIGINSIASRRNRACSHAHLSRQWLRFWEGKDRKSTHFPVSCWLTLLCGLAPRPLICTVGLLSEIME